MFRFTIIYNLNVYTIVTDSQHCLHTVDVEIAKPSGLHQRRLFNRMKPGSGHVWSAQLGHRRSPTLQAVVDEAVRQGHEVRWL